MPRAVGMAMSPTSSSMKTHADNGHTRASSADTHLRNHRGNHVGGGASSTKGASGSHQSRIMDYKYSGRSSNHHITYNSQIRNNFQFRGRRFPAPPTDDEDASLGLPTPTPLQMSETEVCQINGLLFSISHSRVDKYGVVVHVWLRLCFLNWAVGLARGSLFCNASISIVAVWLYPGFWGYTLLYKLLPTLQNNQIQPSYWRCYGKIQLERSRLIFHNNASNLSKIINKATGQNWPLLLRRWQLRLVLVGLFFF